MNNGFCQIFGEQFKLHSSQMLKTTRNILIANMAMSDLLLCLFTMPLTMLDLIHNYRPLGADQVGFNFNLSTM